MGGRESDRIRVGQKESIREKVRKGTCVEKLCLC